MAENIFYSSTEVLASIFDILVFLTEKLCPVPHLDSLLLKVAKLFLLVAPPVLKLRHPPHQLLPSNLQPGEVFPPEPAGDSSQQLQTECRAEAGGGGRGKERLAGLAGEEGGQLAVQSVLPAPLTDIGGLTGQQGRGLEGRLGEGQ